MEIDHLVALVSLTLSVFFWWNARQQAISAERTLEHVKAQIIGWQDQLNKTAISMLGSRPEMVSRQTMLSEAESAAMFSSRMADLAEKLALSDDPERAKIIDAILANHAGIILERQRIAMAAANAR